MNNNFKYKSLLSLIADIVRLNKAKITIQITGGNNKGLYAQYTSPICDDGLDDARQIAGLNA